MEMKDTLVVFQCCKKKQDVELYPNDEFDFTASIPRTNWILKDGEKRFILKGAIDASSHPITALSRYNGYFYASPRVRTRVADETRHGSCQFLIMSAAYCFVDPFQKIHKYEKQMKGETTRYWLKIGLPKVLEEFIVTSGITRAYGFFSKSADYRKIFEAASWSKLSGLKEAGYFYLDEARGTGKILEISSQLMLNLLDTNFAEKPQSSKGTKVVFIRIV
jgi:hypothetical protein